MRIAGFIECFIVLGTCRWRPRQSIVPCRSLVKLIARSMWSKFIAKVPQMSFLVQDAEVGSVKVVVEAS